MPQARKLLREAVYDPPTLQMLGHAFAEAWASVAQKYVADRAAETARVQLANIILSLAAEGMRDPEQLKARGIGTLCAVVITSGRERHHIFRRRKLRRIRL